MSSRPPRPLPAFPTRRSSDLVVLVGGGGGGAEVGDAVHLGGVAGPLVEVLRAPGRGVRGHHRLPALRSEEHTSELQSRENLVCRLLLEKKKTSTDAIEQHEGT